eukprot:2514211-Rhodomonas_salina.1
MLCSIPRYRYRVARIASSTCQRNFPGRSIAKISTGHMETAVLPIAATAAFDVKKTLSVDTRAIASLTLDFRISIVPCACEHHARYWSPTCA